MVELPSDIITDILCKLSVKDLLRFRTLSKPWCSCIDSPEFVKHHLDNRISNLDVLLQVQDRKMYSVNPDSKDKSSAELDYPFKNEAESVYVIGSCNGLVASYNNLAGPEARFALWNPSTGEQQTLPAFKMFCFSEVIGFGFGYDVVNHDYKIVIIQRIRSRMEVLIYSLKENSWRFGTKKFPYSDIQNKVYFCPSRGIACNGVLHWMVIDKEVLREKRFVVAFDIGNEGFHDFPLPDSEDLNNWFDLFVFRNRLQCIKTYGRFFNSIEIWERKKEKDTTWVKMLCSSSFPNKSKLVIGDSALLLDDKENFISWYRWGKKKLELGCTKFPVIIGDDDSEGRSKVLSFYHYTGSLVCIKAIRGSFRSSRTRKAT